MKKSSRPNEASSGLNGHRGRTIPVAMLLILVVLLSASSGIYAGASYFAQQAPGVTVTTTIFTTTTSWTTSTIWSTVTSVVQGILTTIEYTTSTSTVTVTGSTSNRIAKIVTANGNAQIDTAQSKFGGASGLFDGNGDYLTALDSADWFFGTGAFTIDSWVRFSTVAADSHTFVSQYQDFNNLWEFTADTPSTLTFRVLIGGSWKVWVSAAVTWSADTWYHVAVVRSGNSWYLFKDGTQVGSTATDADAVPDFTGVLEVGARTYPGVAQYMHGWLEEVRVTKGLARWTSNFTPPTGPYSDDSNTVLLLHMDGPDASTTFVDG